MIKSKQKPNETTTSKPPKKNKSPTEKAKPSSTRSKSPARIRSPARTKSPSRVPSKSPSRAKTSPARARSPGRPRKPRIELSPPRQSSTPRVVTPRARSPLRQSSLRRSPPRLAKSVASERVLRISRSKYDSDSGSGSDSDSGSVRAGRPSSHVEVEQVEVSESEPISALVRRFTRSSQSREVERIVHVKHFDNIALGKRLGEFSDEDENVAPQKETLPSNLKQFSEFGGVFGALFFTLSTLVGIFWLVIACDEHQCSFTQFPSNLQRFSRISTYFNSITYLGFVAYATFIALVSILPFGGRKVQGLPSKQGRFMYIMNGFFSFSLLLVLGIGLEMTSIQISHFITRNYFQLLCVSTLFGLFLTVYAFVRSFYVPFSALNVHTVGKNPIYGFFMGREVNPRAFGLLDLKMYVLRLGIIGPCFVNFAFLYDSLTLSPLSKPIEENVFDTLKRLNCNPSLLLLVVMQTSYFLNTLVNEHTWITSFEVQYEGFGFMGGVGYLIYPFMVCSVTKYVVDYNVDLPFWQLVIITAMFATGHVFFRGANNQKDAFRKNPYDPALSHLETIPTSRGKKLLCSGFWGVVRHPNYLGDILMNLAFAPFVLSVPPVLTCLSIVVLLVHRSMRDNERCKEKYGSAWERYCSKVKFVLVPKVY